MRRVAQLLEDALDSPKRDVLIKHNEQEKINEVNRKSLESITRKLAKTFKGDSTTKQIVDIADSLQGLLDKSHQEFSDNARALVKKCASGAFKEIINNKYFDIDINEDYKASFVDNSEEGVGGASMSW